MSAGAEPPRARRAAYLLPFQQAGTSEFGDLAGYAAMTVRLRLAELNLSQNLRTAEEAPCRRTGIQQTAAAQEGSAGAQDVPTHFLISGTIETRSQGGRAQEYSLIYSLERVTNCRAERLIQETVPFFAPEALDRFRQMGDAIAFRLEEELSDRALVVVGPITTNAENNPAPRAVRFLEEFIDHRLADSEDLRPVRDRSKAAQAVYRLHGRLETQASGSRIGKLELRAQIAGKDYELFTGRAPADQSRDNLLDFYDQAIGTSLRRVTEMRYRRESGLPEDPWLTDAKTVLEKARGQVKQGEYRAALGLLSGLPRSADVLSLQGRAFFDAGEFPAAAKAYDAALEASSGLSVIWRLGVLRNAGAAWYRSKEYAVAAERYTELLRLSRSVVDDPEAKEPIREAARWRVAALRFAGKRDEALSAYLEGRKLVDDPGDIDGEAGRLLTSIGTVQDLKPVVARLEAELGAGSAVLAKSRERIGNDYYDARDYRQAEQAYRLGLDAAQKAPAPDRHLMASLHNGLGNIAYQDSRMNEAIVSYETALKLERSRAKPDVGYLIIFLGNEAACYTSTGELGKAEVLLKESRQLAEKEFGPESVQAIGTLTALGDVYTDMGAARYPEAQSLLGRAVELLEKQSPRDDSRLINAYNALGWLNRQMDNSREADKLFRKAMGLLESRGETESALYAGMIDNLASVYTMEGKYREALDERKRAVKMARARGANDKAMAPLIFNLCYSLNISQVYDQAAAACQDAYAIYSKFGSGHYMAGYSQVALAEVRTEQAAFAGAEEAYSKGMATYASLADADPTRLLGTRESLGRLRYMEGRYGEAEGIFASVLEGLTKLHGMQHRKVGSAMEELGWTQYHLGKPEAAARFRGCMDIYASRGVPDHPTAASTREGLGRIAIERRDFAAARNLCQGSLDARLKAFGYDSVAVGDSLDCLAVISTAQGSYPEAEAQFKRAQAAYENAFGPEHPKIAEVIEHLAGMRKASGQAAEARHLESRAAAMRAKFTWK